MIGFGLSRNAPPVEFQPCQSKLTELLRCPATDELEGGSDFRGGPLERKSPGEPGAIRKETGTFVHSCSTPRGASHKCGLLKGSRPIAIRSRQSAVKHKERYTVTFLDQQRLHVQVEIPFGPCEHALPALK